MTGYNGDDGVCLGPGNGGIGTIGDGATGLRGGTVTGAGRGLLGCGFMMAFSSLAKFC